MPTNFEYHNLSTEWLNDCPGHYEWCGGFDGEVPDGGDAEWIPDFVFGS